jgi:hypothetical protein
MGLVGDLGVFRLVVDCRVGREAVLLPAEGVRSRGGRLWLWWSAMATQGKEGTLCYLSFGRLDVIREEREERKERLGLAGCGWALREKARLWGDIYPYRAIAFVPAGSSTRRDGSWRDTTIRRKAEQSRRNCYFEATWK